MTPRELLAVAVLVSTNFDERMTLKAGAEVDRATEDWSLRYWREVEDSHALRIGAKRALWLEAQP